MSSLSIPSDPRPWSTRSLAYQYRPFRGMYADVKNRLPYYISDWTEGFRTKNTERIIGSTIRMYFLNLMPAIAYTLDMNARTGGAYGLNESILASALAALVFSVLSVQPLTIVGVTGLISLFNFTVFDIVASRVDYLQFQAWVMIWAAIMHFLIAIFNISDFTRFITDMTGETFGLYVGIIYLQKGFELLITEFDPSQTAGWFNIVVAILFVLVVYFLERVGSRMFFGPFWFRKGLIDYSFAIGIIFFTGFVNFPGEISTSGAQFLPITAAFVPSTNRPWLIKFWELPVAWIFIAIPFAFLLTLLFYFDNNVSSLMAQSREFPVKRPAGFHWDFFLLGCTTFVAGILGLPAPNGLVPQAPTNTESLCILKVVEGSSQLTPGGFLDEDQISMGEKKNGDDESQTIRSPMKVVRTRLVEQRLSHFLMGALILATMSANLLTVLGTMSRAMFSGVFIVVGWGSIEGNGILHKAIFLFRDTRFTPPEHPLIGVKRASIFKFAAIQLVFVAAMVGISETIAAIGFPIIIIALIPIRYYILPRWFTVEELSLLDAPTATSAAVFSSIGGPLDAPSCTDTPESSTSTANGREDDLESLRRRKVERPGEDVEEANADNEDNLA